MQAIIGLMFIIVGIAATVIGIKYGKRQPIKSAVPIQFGFLFGGFYPKLIRLVAVILGVVAVILGISYLL
ncbi:hypothetical protein [Liquorilactobacillus nagelii]|jgi:hypothetical protein|uniref:hypothetical protein n=1 Tax=Liquorilactobacillus TaxID=2767888 RepID=UPI0006F05F89|nr:hypothetical protein [Liquorilactobacillus nagelii]KRL41117.1 hypothetical protein FD45_GL001774 [Liquorilactobacillus nagelii DSM 13675]QYH54046.1 hypothetical protein G6O73_04805 [Liquorilactobacillus nagelii DSM 13675]